MFLYQALLLELGDHVASLFDTNALFTEHAQIRVRLVKLRITRQAAHGIPEGHAHVFGVVDELSFFRQNTPPSRCQASRTAARCASSDHFFFSLRVKGTCLAY